jgi:hypothetical protein
MARNASVEGQPVNVTVSQSDFKGPGHYLHKEVSKLASNKLLIV